MRWAPSSPGALDPCASGFSEVQQCPQGNGCESPGLELSPWLRSAANTGIQREPGGTARPQTSLRFSHLPLPPGGSRPPPHRSPFTLPPSPAGLSLCKSKATNFRMREETGSQIDVPPRWRGECPPPAHPRTRLRSTSVQAAPCHHTSLLHSHGNGQPFPRGGVGPQVPGMNSRGERRPLHLPSRIPQALPWALCSQDREGEKNPRACEPGL